MSARIERAVAGVVAVNAGVLVAGLVVDGHERLFETVHDVIVAFFVLELLARLAANGWRFFARPFNAFDAAVILVSALPLAGVDASLLRLARLARLVHFARHAAHLRLLRLLARPGPAREIGAAMTVHRLGDVDPLSVRVSVYRNLRTGGWSIKTAEKVGETPKGKVIAHADECALTDCVFEVNQTMLAATVAGTGKRGHRRNVFAWVTGKLADGEQVITDPRRVTFHPFERPDFFVVETGETNTTADVVTFGTDGKCYA